MILKKWCHTCMVGFLQCRVANDMVFIIARMPEYIKLICHDYPAQIHTWAVAP